MGGWGCVQCWKESQWGAGNTKPLPQPQAGQYNKSSRGRRVDNTSEHRRYQSNLCLKVEEGEKDFGLFLGTKQIER